MYLHGNIIVNVANEVSAFDKPDPLEKQTSWKF